jgi:sugar/nucleoside kinase (ribokinase family)
MYTAKRFRYITKPLKIEPRDLLNTPLLLSRSFHFLASPSDTKDQIRELLNLRHSLGVKEPTIIWEPAPPSCIPENLSACLETVEIVDIFSPNHIELAALFGIDLSLGEQFDRSVVEGLAHRCLASGIGTSKQGTIVVRAGHEGCCVYSRKRKELIWLPPYYLGSPKIIDPTGAGNAFLGGFAIGLMETGDDIVAACYGTVASTFALEQIGLPVLDVLDASLSFAADGMATGSEIWNGISVRARLREYTSNLGLRYLPIGQSETCKTLVQPGPPGSANDEFGE